MFTSKLTGPRTKDGYRYKIKLWFETISIMFIIIGRYPETRTNVGLDLDLEI